MKLYLLRHGRTEGNVRKLYYGWTEVPLLPEGRAQLAARPKPPKVAAYYTSGMIRTEETLRIVCGDVPHTAIPALREMNFGEFEMHSYEELKDVPSFRRWCEGDNQKNRCPGGESGEEFVARAMQGLQPILDAGEDALVVTHGGVIAEALAKWFGGTRYDWMPLPGTGYCVEVVDGKPLHAEPF